MIIFISGSINSGKSTTGRALAKRLGCEFVEFDDIRHSIPEPNLEKAIPLVLDKGIEILNAISASGKSAVAAYPIGKDTYGLLVRELIEKPLVITLAPRLGVAQNKRGDRELSDWELSRIKHHYEVGIASPTFGYVIDNSDLNVEQVVDRIMKLIPKHER